MTKEELRKSLDFVNEERERLQRELERKDNIINELKIFIQKEIDEYYQSDDMTLDSYGYEAKIILDKIKEIEND